jgi:hypothetical protein
MDEEQPVVEASLLVHQIGPFAGFLCVHLQFSLAPGRVNARAKRISSGEGGFKRMPGHLENTWEGNVEITHISTFYGCNLCA